MTTIVIALMSFGITLMLASISTQLGRIASALEQRK